MLRFRRFRSRVLTLLLGVLFAALATTYYFVSKANQQGAYAQIQSDLEVGARIFEEATHERIGFLTASAKIMTGDYALKSVLLADETDTETLTDILTSYTQRMQAPIIALFKRDGEFLVAASEKALTAKEASPFSRMIAEATAQDAPVRSAFAYLDNRLHALVVVPLHAPDIVNWFGLGFPIDEAFATKLKTTSRVEVSFVNVEENSPARVLATTLPAASATQVAQIIAAGRKSRLFPTAMDLPGDRYVTLVRAQDMLGADPIHVVLQRPLSPELAVAHDLENVLALTSLAALALATLAAFWIARGVSDPVQQLAAHTRHVASGDYERRIELDRVDELGQLATAFNNMSVGLAERDRVRDLLDKNVSPEVAAQLMRDGAALGGEEREVTILFADLRNFTTMSETFSPRDLVQLLNRYLDRMSAEIESRGGVIDKFIGDAIMALFGAPLDQTDAADRAIAAALAMERALLQLNAELAAEGKTPLGIGVGINTDRVIAGNIGSHRRLNYSVIGDGVNVAARLQAQTRTPEFRTNIIASAATLASRTRATASAGGRTLVENLNPRPLGTIHVKGRAKPIEIFAIEI